MLPTKHTQPVIQYGLNWSINDEVINLFSSTGQSNAGGPILPARREMLKSLLRKFKGEINHLRICPALAEQLWKEGVFTGAMLAGAEEEAGISITLEVKVDGETVALMIRPDVDHMKICYRDGTNESRDGQSQAA